MSSNITDWKTKANPIIDTRATKPKPWFVKILASRAAVILGLDVLLFGFFTFQTDGLFASDLSIESLLRAGTEALMLAIGLAMLLGSGIFDLSLGANLVLSSVVGALVLKAQVGEGFSGDATQAILISLLAAVATGMLFGLLNGVLVAYGRMNALIATLATMGFATGVAWVFSGGSDIAGLPYQIQEGFGLATLGPLPLPTFIALAATFILYLVVRYTRFGSRTLAIGSSRAASERVGIKVPQHLLVLTIIAGGLAGLAGFIDISTYAGTAMNGHANDALNAVTAAVIGGTLLEGGRISILGTVWGTALAVILQSGLVMIGVSAFFQLMIIAVVLLIAVGMDGISSRKRSRA